MTLFLFVEDIQYIFPVQLDGFNCESILSWTKRELCMMAVMRLNL